MTEVHVSVAHDEPDQICLPITWSLPAATLRQRVHQLIVEPDEDGLIIAIIETGWLRSPQPDNALTQANCLAQVTVSPDHLLALIKRLQKAYLAQLARKIRFVKTFCSNPLP